MIQTHCTATPNKLHAPKSWRVPHLVSKVAQHLHLQALIVGQLQSGQARMGLVWLLCDLAGSLVWCDAVKPDNNTTHQISDIDDFGYSNCRPNPAYPKGTLRPRHPLPPF